MSHEASTPVAKRGQQNAVVVARQRLIEVRESAGTGHPDYASALIQLALLLIMHGDPTEAEPLLREALEIRRATLGERHPDYATCLSSLAGLLWARGDLDAAEPLLRQALEIRCEILGERHPKSIVSQNSLDQLLQAKKAWDSAAHLDTTEVVPPSSAPEPEAAPAAPEPATEPEPVPVAAAPAEPEHAPVVEAYTEPEPAAAAEELAAPSEPAPIPEPVPVAVAPPIATEALVAPEATVSAAHSREELLAAVEDLAGRFADLGSELHGAVGRLKDQGVLPGENLLHALRDNHDRFSTLRHDVFQLAQSLGMADVESRPAASLDDLDILLAELERYELERSRSGQARRQALDTLARVAALVYADRRDFPPLRECQEAARGLEQAIGGAHPSELPPEAFALADGNHAYNALLALADPEASLNDEEWANALELVQNQLGKQLSVAAARAKIVSGPAA